MNEYPQPKEYLRDTSTIKQKRPHDPIPQRIATSNLQAAIWRKLILHASTLQTSAPYIQILHMQKKTQEEH